MVGGQVTLSSGTSGNVISEPKRSHSHSFTVPPGTLHYSFLSHLTPTSRSLSTFHLLALSGKEFRMSFLNYSPTVKPSTVCVKQIPFCLSCQADRAKDLGVFCCLVSHLTLCPEIYYENSLPPSPQALNHVPSSIAPNSNFSKGSSLHLLDPFTPGLGSLHTVTDSLLDRLLPRSPNYKLS